MATRSAGSESTSARHRTAATPAPTREQPQVSFRTEAEFRDRLLRAVAFQRLTDRGASVATVLHTAFEAYVKTLSADARKHINR